MATQILLSSNAAVAIPANAYAVEYTLVGAGGGGGGASIPPGGPYHNGGGGGAGAVVFRRMFWLQNVGSTLAVVVGVGGIGGAYSTGTATSGAAGGDSSITIKGSTFYAKGGSAGVRATAAANGAGGAGAPMGVLTAPSGSASSKFFGCTGGAGGTNGGTGGAGVITDKTPASGGTNPGGVGGSCLYGPGGEGGSSTVPAGDGHGYGSGGGGGGGTDAQSTANWNGGDGADGVVILTWITSPNLLTVCGLPDTAYRNIIAPVYSFTFTATGGSQAGYSFAVTDGDLPTGLSLSSGGVLSGVATEDGTFEFDVTVTDSLGATGTQHTTLVVALDSYGEIVLADSPVMWFRSVDNRPAYVRPMVDWSGNGRTGTYIFDATYQNQSGPKGTLGMGGGGTNTGYCQVNDHASFNITGDFSVECWCLWPVSPTQDRRSFVAKTDPTNPMWDISTGDSAGSNTSKIRAVVKAAGTTATVLSTGNIAGSTWRHIVVTRQGTAVKLYVDGVLNNTGTVGSGSVVTNTQKIYMGGNQATKGQSGYWCEPALYASCLSADQVLSHYKAVGRPAHTISLLHFNGDWVDETGKVWTPSGSPTLSSSDPKYGSGNASFDGSNDISTPSTSEWIFATNDHTIEFWMRRAPGSTNSGAIFGKDQNQNVNFGSVYVQLSTAGTIRYVLNPNAGDSTGRFNVDTTTDIRDDTWHHIAFTRSGNVWRAFTDGVLEASTVSAFTQRSESAAVYIAAVLVSSAASGYGLFEMDDFCVTAACRYFDDFTPPWRERS